LGPETTLTPAQVTFVQTHLPDFSPETGTVELAGQAGSMRYFLRVRSKSGTSAILVVWDSKDEDWPRFLAIPGELSSTVPFLPRIRGSDSRHGLILEEDLGDVTLKHFCTGRSVPEVENIYCKVLEAAGVWQNTKLGRSPTMASRTMDVETFLWETDYFARRCVVDFCGNEGALGPEWEKERLAVAVRAAGLEQTFIQRDFQSENVLICDGKVRFVDFQGARLGPPAYDVASLLFDPYCDFLESDMTERLFKKYAELSLRVKANEPEFLVCAAQRLMQALGAYGNLSIHKGKTRYREFIPVAFERLNAVMKKMPEYKAIGRVVEECRNTIKINPDLL